MDVVTVEPVLTLQKKVPHACPHIIKCIMDDILEIEPIISFLFHGTIKLIA